MKILDFFIYILYVATKKVNGGAKDISYAKWSARNFFCFVLGSTAAFLITNAVYNIPAYRRFYLHILPQIFGAFIGMLHIIMIGFTTFSFLKKHYTDEKIEQISIRNNGILSKKAGIVLYVVTFIIHTALIIYMFIPMIALFVDKKIKWNL